MKALEDYLEKYPKKKLIFDMDATILELLIPWEVWFEKIEDHITPIDSDIWNLYASGKLPEHRMLNEFIKKYGESAKKNILDITAQVERDYLKGIRKNEDLIAFINAHKDSYEMFVWSSNTKNSIENAFHEVGISPSHFKKIVSLDDVLYRKPDAFGFTLIDDGTALGEYLFIGDSNNDEGAAKALNMDFFKVSF